MFKYLAVIEIKPGAPALAAAAAAPVARSLLRGRNNHNPSNSRFSLDTYISYGVIAIPSPRCTPWQYLLSIDIFKIEKKNTISQGRPT